jgi:hypothetical protein
LASALRLDVLLTVAIVGAGTALGRLDPKARQDYRDPHILPPTHFTHCTNIFFRQSATGMTMQFLPTGIFLD